MSKRQENKSNQSTSAVFFGIEEISPSSSGSISDLFRRAPEYLNQLSGEVFVLMTQVEEVPEMSEEESFVILGSSSTSLNSTPSLLNNSLREASLTDVKNEHTNSQENKVLIASDILENYSVVNKSSKADIASVIKNDESIGDKSISKSSITLPTKLSTSSKCDTLSGPDEDDLTSAPSKYGSLSSSKNDSLAASFLLGEVKVDELKATVFSQFPSLCTSQTQIEDILKFKKILMEYKEMHENLRETNKTMRQNLIVFQKLHEDHLRYMKECQEQIAKLKNENMELKEELESKMKQIQITKEAMKKENQDLIQAISEKSSIIQNMRVRIERLEQRENSTFEYVKRNDNEKDPEHEYIHLIEHQKIINDLETKLSTVVAENIEMQDMKNVYVDELNCLKVNLTAAEELLKKARADITLLKCKDMEKSDLFEKYEKEKKEMKQEINLLRNQLEIYRKDFEMERIARQNLAGEKDQLLTDLKILQRKNQQLIEEAQSRLDQESKQTSVTTFTSRLKDSFSRTKMENSSKNNEKEGQEYARKNYVCPICNITKSSLSDIQEHVQACLDSV